MAADPQLIQITESFAKTTTSYLIVVVIIASIFLMPIGVLIIILEKKVTQLGEDFRKKRKNLRR